MSLRRGLFIFLLLSVSVSTFILFRSVDSKAIYILRNMDLAIAFWVIPAMLGAWICDAGRFCAVARAMGYKITFFRGLTLTWLHYFGCAVTPLQVGGGPFQVYVLYKKDNVPVGSGIAITLLRTLLGTFILSMAAPSARFLAPELIERSGFARGVFIYVLILSCVVWCLFIFSVVRPKILQRLIGRVVLWGKKFFRFKKVSVNALYRLIGREMKSYSGKVREMVQPGRRRWSFLSLLLTLGYFMCLFSILPLLIKALGFHVPLDQVFSAQAMFMFMLYFIPTPGGSGVAEGGGAAIFSALVPVNIAGVLAIAWRFFTEYIAIFIGAFVALKMIGWGNAEQLIRGKEGELLDSERRAE